MSEPEPRAPEAIPTHPPARGQRRRRRIALVLGVLVIGLAVWLLVLDPVAPRNLEGLTGDPTRGEYVLRMAGCIACHTDEKGGGKPLAGGAALETPFGTFFAPNITSHPVDGVGGWAASDLARALTAGRGPDGRHYFPVFPYPSYTLMTDQDIVDLHAALAVTEPVAGRAKAHEVPFPFSVRLLMAGWKRLFLEPGPYQPVAGRDATWNRGAYLAIGPGHCQECHTPRNPVGAIDRDRMFAGNPEGPDGDEVPAIGAAALDSEGYVATDVAELLGSGMMPDGDFIGGSMAEVVDHSTSHLTDEDRAAIAAYLMAR